MNNIHAPRLMLLLSAVCLTSVASAQTSWWKEYGGTGADDGNSVQQTSDGGYVIAGYTSSFGSGGDDAYLVKTGASGDALWTRTYGGTHADGGYSVQQTSDGGYIMAGSTASFGSEEYLYLIRINASGDTLWTRTYGGSVLTVGYSVQQTSDSGYIVTGCIWPNGQEWPDVYLIRTDASGDTIWTRTYGGQGDDEGYSVRQTADGGYIVTGYTYSYGQGVPSYGNLYLIKTDASGDTLWTRVYGGIGDDDGCEIEQTTDGGYIIAGYTDPFGTENGDVYLAKTNASGDALWTRTWGGTSVDGASSVQQTSDGGYIVAGATWSFGAGGFDIYLIKTDAQGDSLWTRTYGGTREDVGHEVRQTTDGGYIIAGRTYSFGEGDEDVYLIKTDSLGNVGLAEESRQPQAPQRKPAATVVRGLSPGTVAFDAMGRRMVNPRSGILFVRDRSAITKVLLQR